MRIRSGEWKESFFSAVFPQHLCPSWLFQSKKLLWSKAGQFFLPSGKLTVRPWQIGVGRLGSIKNWWFSGSMFIYQRVNRKHLKTAQQCHAKSILFLGSFDPFLSFGHICWWYTRREIWDLSNIQISHYWWYKNTVSKKWPLLDPVRMER